MQGVANESSTLNYDNGKNDCGSSSSTPPRYVPQPPSYSKKNTPLKKVPPQMISTSAPLNHFILQAITIASLGGILFGYDMGVVSGALPQLTTNFSLSESQQEMVVAFLYLGGGFGAAVGGTICDIMGRRYGILITDVVFCIGAAVLYTANTFSAILLGRIIVGFAVSVSGIADVSYLHEISPVEWRGAIVSVNEACISLGFLLAYVAGYWFSLRDPEEGWRIIFGAGAIIAVVQFAGMIFMPESPVWLREKGRVKEAEAAARRIHGCHYSYDTDPSITNSSVDDKLENQNEYHVVQDYPTNFLSNIEHHIYRIRAEITKHYRQSVIAVFLAIMQQFCGHPNVLNFAPEIFSQLGFTSDKSKLGGTLLLGLMKFITTCMVIWKIEYLGRRFLLIGGMSLISISLVFLSIAFAGNQGDDDIMPTANQYIALFGVFGVAIGYAASFGPLTWLLVSEMFPSSIRGRALGACTIVTYISASLISFSYLSGQSLLGPSVPFAIYCVLTATSTVFAFFAIPDTGGKTVNEIRENIKEMCWWRQGGCWQRFGNQVSNGGKKRRSSDLMHASLEENIS